MGDQFLLWSYTHGQGRNFYHLKFRFHLYLRFFSAVWRSYLLCFSAWHLFMPYFPVKCWYFLQRFILFAWYFDNDQFHFWGRPYKVFLSVIFFIKLNLEDYLFSAWWMISFFDDSQFFTSFREHCTPERSFYHPQTSVSFRSLRIKFIPQLFQMAFNARWNHAPFARRSTLLSCGCLLHSWKKIVPDNIKLWRFEESFQLLIEQFHLSWRVNAGFNGHCPNCHKIYSWINLHSSFKLGKSLCSHQASRLEASGFSFSFFNLGSIGMLFPFFFVSLCGAWGGEIIFPLSLLFLFPVLVCLHAAIVTKWNTPESPQETTLKSAPQGGLL